MAQQSVDTLLPPADSYSHFESLGKKAAHENLERFKQGKRQIRQQAQIDDITSTAQQARLQLRRLPDTNRLNLTLSHIEAALVLIHDGVTIHPEPFQYYRNLATSTSIAVGLQSRLIGIKKDVDPFVDRLSGYKYSIDSLSSDSTLFLVPGDSLNRLKYMGRMEVLATTLANLDSTMNLTIERMLAKQVKIDYLLYRCQLAIDEFDHYQAEVSSTLLQPELPVLTQRQHYLRTTGNVIDLSWKKSGLVLQLYLREQLWLFILLLLSVGASTVFLRSLSKRVDEEKLKPTDPRGHLVTRYPLYSAIVWVPSVFQFLFIDPPAAFSCFLWLASAISLAVVMRGYIEPYWSRFWLTLIVFFVFAFFANSMLLPTAAERNGSLLLSLAGLTFGIIIFRQGKWKLLTEKRIIWFIAFMMLAEFAAAIALFAGLYNLGKALMVSGFFGVVIAILFLWTLRLVNEGLRLATKTFNGPQRKFFYIDFNKLGDRVPGVFYVLLVVGWLLLLGRNFYAFRQVVRPVTNFLTSQVSIGHYQFTVMNIFVFLSVIVGSLLLSKIISLFADEADTSHGMATGVKQRVSLGSWLLVARILIICAGIFLAFAAAGIPLDRITIIFGALSVGIGLGLQGLVSNLVSGLIMAFERPVDVGDVIEVDGTLGTMKSIGFRSSTITGVNGANMVIPNNTLLNNKVVNWSKGPGRRRVDMVVGVAYGTNLEKARDIVAKVLDNNDAVMSIPEPIVVVKEFADSYIAIESFFWVSLLNKAAVVKSDVMLAIESSFRDAGISIPHPQMDLTIKRN